jgi:hypothetical protein
MISDTQLGPSVLSSLATFCSTFVRGRFPSAIAPYYGSARLIPLVKRDNVVRPLAVSDRFRRLACKLALTLITADIGPLFQPFQLGVGCPNTADTIIHSVASTLESLCLDECILQVDFSNAFNMVDRATFIRLVKICGLGMFEMFMRSFIMPKLQFIISLNQSYWRKVPELVVRTTSLPP